MYFRPDAPLHVTNHNRAIYTNARLWPHPPVDLNIATLTPATTISEPITTVWTHVVERLEATTTDGADEFMVSTGGDAHYEDLCVILSFAFKATFDEDHDYVQRLVSRGGRPAKTAARGPVVRRVLDTEVTVSADEIDQVKTFVENLLALHRPEYERVLRVIRRIVDACRRGQQDPTSAYTDMVAALEALSEDFNPGPLTWERLDSRKRKLIDPVLKTFNQSDAAAVRDAVLAAERAGSKNRFIEFVTSHTGPDYYRKGLQEADRAVRPTQLRRVLSRAYDIRSLNVHGQRELAREAWVMADGAHTAEPVDHDLTLTHEGLHHLCQHVVRSFIASASTEIDTRYDYRAHLPNVVRMRFAPEYFIGNAATMTAALAPQRLDDFSNILIEVMSGRTDGIPVDLRPPLERAQQLLATRKATPSQRRSMLAIYLLWHEVMAAEYHCANPESTLEEARQDLAAPSLESFIVATLLQAEPDWSVDAWHQLAQDRHRDLHRRKPQPAHPRIDAALWGTVATHLHRAGAETEAAEALSNAVESVPGHPDLLKQEARLNRGEGLDLDWRAFVLGPPPPKPEAATAELTPLTQSS